MKPYHHLTQMDICCLFYLLHLGISRNQIPLALNKHRSSVSRLIKRCPGEEFNPKASYEKYLENRKKRKKKSDSRKNRTVWVHSGKAYRYFNPEIIALKWNKQHENDSIFFNTIYSAIKAGIFKKSRPNLIWEDEEKKIRTKKSVLHDTPR